MQFTIIVATVIRTLVGDLLIITVLCFSDQLSRFLEPKVNGLGRWDREVDFNRKYDGA